MEAGAAIAPDPDHHQLGQQQQRGDEDDAEQERVVYCAVGKEWKANLQWVLASILHAGSRNKRLVLAHLHRPPSRINMMGAWVPVSQLAQEEVAAYRQLEEEKIGKVLDGLLQICKSQKVSASKIIIATDDTAKGLVQLVDDHGVTELVMGAASDRAYTRKMRAPRSKKALTVQRKANPSCKIWFVCKGNLVCTREAREGLRTAEPSTTSTSSRSSTSDYSRSKSSPRLQSEQDSADPGIPSVDQTPSKWDQGVDRDIEDLNHQAIVVAESSTASVSEIVDEPAIVQQPQQETEEDPPQIMPSPDGSDAGEMDDALYEKLRDAIMEAENLRHEAYEETRRRQMADRELAEASRMADEAESSYRQEVKRRKEVEQMLARERAEMERDRQELDDILEQMRKVNDRSDELERHIANSERAMGDLEARLSESYNLLDTLRREQGGARESMEEESEARSDDDGDDDEEEGSSSVLKLSYSEVDEATEHFDESVRIDAGGEGGRGKVYRGKLLRRRGMAVAVKVLDRDVAVDEAKFSRQVEAVSRLRHPNLATVVGACPAARAVVYELVPGGSLEAHLGGESETALPWHARCGVAYRTCSALAFLHSSGAVHGDVRPANILLGGDGDYSSCRLSGLGTRGLVRRQRQHLGGRARAYADPWYLATGELSPRCDVYALGVVLLRLVTGRPAFLAMKAAREAAGGGRAWREVVDAGAGGWPAERGREVAQVGLRCCDLDLERRRARQADELLEAARGALEAAMSAAPSRSTSSLSDGDGGAPAYFVCPILKEVMREPVIAGDGFTYEAEAMREWLGSGHDTSPMTNLKLPTTELIPNHAIRSAIHDWRHRRRFTEA